MQNEREANAIAWGLDGFQKSSSRVMTDAMGEGLEPFSAEEIIVTRGARFHIGIEFFPSSKWEKNLEEFITCWEAQTDFFQFHLQLRHGESTVHRETSLAQKCSMEADPDKQLDCIVMHKTKRGVFIGTHTAVQLPAQYTNIPLTLTLVLAVVVPPSKVPSNYRRGMSTEEQELRALLESGRYRPPRVAPREVVVPVRVMEALEVKCWAQSVEPTASLACVELRNMHPCKTLRVHHVEINLEGSVRIEEMPMKADGQFSSVPRLSATAGSLLAEFESNVILTDCEPSLDVWFNLIEVRDKINNPSMNPITIGPGEAYSVVHNICPKSVVNEALSSWGAIDPRLPLSSCGLPPPDFSGDFITPVEVRWSEALRSSPPLPAATAPITVFPSADNSDCVVTSSSLCWGVDKRVGKEFTVDLEGETTGRCLKPILLRLTVTNLTAEKRSIRVYLQQPDSDGQLFYVASTNQDELHSIQQAQWMSAGVVNHDIEISLRDLLPGEATPLSVHLIPTRPGLVSFTDLFVVDINTKEIFRQSSSFEIYVEDSD